MTTTQLRPSRHPREAHTAASSATPSAASLSEPSTVSSLSSAVSGPWALALDSVVSRLQASEQRLRTEQASQVALYAEALDQASPDHFATLQAGRLVHGHAQAELMYRSIRAELACALGLSEHTIERRMSHAYELTTCYPDTFLALRTGEIGLAHTEVITTAGRGISTDLTVSSVTRRASYETAVLVHATRETPARLRPIARRLAEQYADQSIDERHATACARRRVWLTDHEDGMSDLTAHLPTVEAHAIYDRLTRASKQIIEHELRVARETAVIGADAAARIDAAADADSAVGSAAARSESVDGRATLLRSRDQIRTDLFSELLRTQGEQLLRVADATQPADAPNPGVLGGVRAHVQIFVSDDTLFADTLRLDDEDTDWGAPTSRCPAELAGGGPIDTATARLLAADAPFWDLTRQHPTTGAVLSVERYRPSEQIRRTLRARDLHCRFPGCRAPVHRCDLDHTVDAANGGPTATNNLAHLCRGHHVLKHHGGWQVTQNSDGTMHWRSPTGRAYADRPASRVRFEQTQPREKLGNGRPGCGPPKDGPPKDGPPNDGQPNSDPPGAAPPY